MAASPRYYPLVGALVGAVGAAVLLAAGAALPWTVAVLALDRGDGARSPGRCTRTGSPTPSTASAAPPRSGRSRSCATAGSAPSAPSRSASSLAAKVAALAALPPGLAAAALVAGHGLSRLSSVAVVASSRYLRPAGAAGFTAEGIGTGGLALAAATGGLCLLGLAAVAGIAAAAAAALGLAAGHALARARLRAPARRLHRRRPRRRAAAERARALPRACRVALILARHTRPAVAGVCRGRSDAALAPELRGRGRGAPRRAAAARPDRDEPARALPPARRHPRRPARPAGRDRPGPRRDGLRRLGRPALGRDPAGGARRLGGRPPRRPPARRRERRDAARPHPQGARPPARPGRAALPSPTPG